MGWGGVGGLCKQWVMYKLHHWVFTINGCKIRKLRTDFLDIVTTCNDQNPL